MFYIYYLLSEWFLRGRGTSNVCGLFLCMSLGDIFNSGWGPKVLHGTALPAEDMTYPGWQSPTGAGQHNFDKFACGFSYILHAFLIFLKNLPLAWIILCPYKYMCCPLFSIQVGKTIPMTLPQRFLCQEWSLLMSCRNTLSVCCFMVPLSILHCRHMAHLCY